MNNNYVYVTNKNKMHFMRLLLHKFTDLIYCK